MTGESLRTIVGIVSTKGGKMKEETSKTKGDKSKTTEEKRMKGGKKTKGET